MSKLSKKRDAEDLEEVKAIIVQSLEDSKAEDIEVIDLAGKTDIASYMVIATGRIDRHIRAIADNLVKNLRENRIHCNAEGMNHKDWVLVDAFDILIHVFRKEAREIYDLESLWKK